MTLENFPKHYTYTITAEVHADNDGRPWTVKIPLHAGLSDTSLAEIAMQALNNWEGSCRPRWTLSPRLVEDDDVFTFDVLSASL